MHDTMLHCDPTEFQTFFTLGVRISSITPQQRRIRRIQQQRNQAVHITKKMKINQRKSKKTSKKQVVEFPPWFQKYFKQITEKDMWLKTPIFNIFPDSLFLNSISSIMYCILPSVEQQNYILQAWSKPPFGTPESWTGSRFWSPELVEELKNGIFKVNRLRSALRRFLNHWRLTRFNKANEEDLFTCEVPKHPITIVDWSSKQIWTFEAQSIMKDMTNRLLNHSGCFEEPLNPRNPYTNLNLTASQTISIYSQMLKYTIPNSFPFTAYRASHMNLNCFRFEHRIYLAIHALRKTFEDIHYYETQEKMLDFIEMAFDRQGAEVNSDAYEFVIKRFSQTEQLQKWKQLCLKYHEFEIKYADFDTQRQKAQDKLFVQTYPLLHQQDEILQLFERHTPRPRVDVTNITEVMLFDLLQSNPLLLQSQPLAGLQILFESHFLTDE